MKKYSLILSNLVKSGNPIQIFELCKNGESLFADFVEEIEQAGNLFKDLAKGIRIIEETAKLRPYPVTKFRLLKGHPLDCKVYEAKANQIRIYLFQEKHTGRIIVTGGLKSHQKKDLKKIYQIIKDYQNE